ncbi:ABC transporter substrate-binding protein [Cytobacillus sp. FJAT-54145]|uniref:ABC transporter substrate-binding protein n=1 Tax=Cytobacillus spartinae TaxID=3299023 RepID=A0ABW6KDU1_9BACI
MEYLISLRERHKNIKPYEEVRISINEIAEIFCSSLRNTNYLLKKLNEEQRITWIPGRGRGNLSTLIYHSSFSDVVDEYITQMTAQNRVGDIVNFANSSTLSEEDQKLLFQSLYEHLGPRFEHSHTGTKSILRIILPQEIHSLDPLDTILYSEAHLVNQLFNTLVSYNSQLKQIEPCIAYAWKKKQNGRQWTFYLRKNVRFHNGDTVTASEVQFSINRILREGLHSAIYPLLTDIQEVEVIDDFTITLRLKRENLFFPRILSSFHCSIIHPSHSHVPIGTGPFMVKAFNKDFIRMHAFEDYFRERALIDQLDIWMNKKGHTLPNQYTALNTPEKDSTSVTLDYQLLGSRFLAFNQNKSGYQHDLNFRLAINEIMNPVKMIKELGGNRSLAATSFLPSISRDSKFYDSSVEKAREYLLRSGYKGETIHLYYFNLNEGYESAEWLKKQGKKIGLNIELSPINYDTNESVLNGDIFLLSVILDQDVELSLLTIYKSENSFLRKFLDKTTQKKVDLELEVFQMLETPEERMVHLQRIEDMLKDNILVQFLYHATNKLSYHPYLKGLEINSLGLPDYHHLWIDPEDKMVHVSTS